PSFTSAGGPKVRFPLNQDTHAAIRTRNVIRLLSFLSAIFEFSRGRGVVAFVRGSRQFFGDSRSGCPFLSNRAAMPLLEPNLPIPHTVVGLLGHRVVNLVLMPN